MKTRIRAVLLLTTAFHSSLGSSAQTLEEVREVVRTYFDTEGQMIAARKKLREWGNDALPRLAQLADGGDRKDDWSIVCCVTDVRTTESFDLLVRILEGKTGIERHHALMAFQPEPWSDAIASHLRNHPGFRAAVRTVAEGGSWLEKGHAARIAAAMDWADFAPLIQEMLEDENVSLRAQAASALSELLGRPVEAELPETVFPAIDLIDGLVGDAQALASHAGQTVTEAFVQQRDGFATLMLGDARTFAPYPLRDPRERLSFTVPVTAVSGFDRVGSPARYVSLAVELGFGGAGADYAVAWDAEGRELWRYVPPRGGLEAAAVLYDDAGPYGVALGPGGETGLIGLDSDGKPAWEIPRVHVLYELHTHRLLPGVLLVVHGQFSIVHHGADGIAADEVTGAFMRGVRSRHERLYARNGLLVPASDGSPEAILAGSGPSSEPVVACFDERYSRKWKVALSEPVTRLAMLEPIGRERLFVVTTAAGELLLLNQHGVLRWRGALPVDRASGPVQVFELAAGGSDAFIVLRCARGFFVYPVRTELLPPR